MTGLTTNMDFARRETFVGGKKTKNPFKKGVKKGVKKHG